MRCVACEGDTKPLGKGRPAAKCGQCGHLFALNPKVDGMADMAVKLAIDSVTANGEHCYLPAQLNYEMERRLARPGRIRWIIALGIVAVVAILLFFIWNIAAAIVSAIIGFVLVAKFIDKIPAKQQLRTDLTKVNVPRILQRYAQLNPPTHVISPEAADEAEPSAALGEVVHDRLLICERRDHAIFYRANGFDLRNACHVVSPEDPPELWQPMLAAVRGRAALQVFLVHDLTPRGLEFARSVAADPEWFGGHDGPRVVDLGLIGEHAAALGLFQRPLMADERLAGQPAIADLAPDRGIDLAVLRPKRLLELTERGIEEGRRFELQGGSDAGVGGFALMMGGDSE